MYSLPYLNSFLRQLALSGLGAGGRINTDVYLTDSSNAALYACFAIVGFFAGSVNNTLGPKYTLLV